MSRKRFRQAIAWLVTGSIVAIAVIGLLFAIVRSLLVSQLNEASDHSIVAVTRLETELQRLVIDAQRFAISDPLVPVDELRTRTDILFSRVALAEGGDMRRLLDQLPQYTATMARLHDFLSTVDALLATGSVAPAAGTEIARRGIDLQSLLSDFSFAATERTGEMRTEARQHLLGLVEWLALGFFLLVAATVSFLIVLARLNRKIVRQRLAEITATIPGAVFQMRITADGTMQHVFVNRAFTEIRGYEPSTARRVDGEFEETLPLVVPDDQAPLLHSLIDVRDHQRPINVDFRINHPTAGLRWLNLRAAGRREENERDVLISGVFLDVTDQKSQEAALTAATSEARHASQQLTDLTDAIPGAVFQIELSRHGEARFLMASRKSIDLIGIPVDELLAMDRATDDAMRNLLPAYRPQVREAFIAALRQLKPLDVDAQLSIAGSVRWLRTLATVRRLDDQRTLLNGVWLDVTEHKEQEAAVAEATAEARRISEQLTEVTDAIPGVVYQMEVEPDGRRRFLMVSRKARDLLGQTPESLLAIDRDVGDLMHYAHPRFRDLARDRIIEAQQTLGQIDFDVQVEVDTRTKWLRTLATARRLPNGHALFSGVWIDVTERQMQEEALAHAEAEARRISEQLRDLTDAIPGAVFQLRMGEDGVRFTFANSQFRTVRGVDPNRLIDGMAGTGATRMAAEDWPAVRAAIVQGAADNTPIDVEFRDIWPDQVKWLNLRAIARRDEAGTIVVSGVFIDVTDRKAQADVLEEARRQAELSALWLEDTVHELEGARRKAEEATQAKSSFLAMMSHEIRTPMNGVMTMAELLDQTQLTADQRSMTAIVRASSASLLTIINDILDFSKIEAGKLDIETVPYDLCAVIEEAGELLSGRADEKGIELIIDLDPALPAMIIGDPTRLRQMVLNLAGNAVKFTERGSVVIRAACLGTNRFRVEVADTGIGLTPAQQAKLFRPFEQADTSTSRRFGGTGLGLTISLKLCEMMGGRIGCDSEAGAGSTFWFELPLRPAAEGGAAAGPEHPIGPRPVLVVGGSPLRREALTRHLRWCGVSAPAWGDPQASVPAQLQAARGEPANPALVVLLPAGEAAVRDVIAALASTDTPQGRVILVGSRTLGSSLDAGMRQRIFATLTFPIRRQPFWRALAAAWDLAPLEQRSGPSEEILAPPSVETAREAGTLVLVAEDNLTNQIVIRRLLERRGYALEIASDGRQALAMWRAGRYGLLLTDFHMPEMDGFELAGAIRAHEANTPEQRRLPIVALTADALPGTRRQCLDNGMDDYLTKPIDQAALSAVLARYLPDGRHLASSPEAPSAPGRDSPVDPEILLVQQLVDIFGELNAEALEFLESYLETVPQSIDDLTAALRGGDLQSARDLAHTLKGSARSVGAERFGQAAADIQDALDGGTPPAADLVAQGLPPLLDELLEALRALRAATPG